MQLELNLLLKLLLYFNIFFEFVVFKEIIFLFISINQEVNFLDP